MPLLQMRADRNDLALILMKEDLPSSFQTMKHASIEDVTEASQFAIAGYGDNGQQNSSRFGILKSGEISVLQYDRRIFF